MPKVIPGFPNYTITKSGVVRSLKRNKTLTPFEWSTGYLYVSLSINGRKGSRSVHTLILTTFVGLRPKGFQAAHLNGDRKDNRLSNLKWVTPKENCNHKVAHGTKLTGEKTPKAKLTRAQVESIRREYRYTGPRDSNSAELAKKYGVSRVQICNVASGRDWKDPPNPGASAKEQER